MRHAGVLANLSGLQVLANASDLQAKPDGHAPMAALGHRKRPAGDEEDSSDGSKKETFKKPRQINARDDDNDNDNDDEIFAVQTHKDSSYTAVASISKLPVKLENLSNGTFASSGNG
jgi:hypothetical protein